MKALVIANIDALQQLQTIINETPEKHYDVAPVNATSSLGKHVRHVADHYAALKSGLTENVVDYNLRNRESVVESNSHIAREVVDDIINWLQSELHTDKSLTAISEVSTKETISIETPSSLSRELSYLINHTIHHVAYMTLLAKSFAVELDDNIGIAPSTASYLRTVAET